MGEERRRNGVERGGVSVMVMYANMKMDYGGREGRKEGSKGEGNGLREGRAL